MKTTKIFAVLLMFVITSWLVTQKTFAQHGYVSFQVFYDNLSPYGYWVDNPNYGYVWIPDVDPGFSPYATNGHWVYTDDGWTWVSNYEWGWAPFHYGRWDYDNSYGWFWVPGNEWGPAWVTWRRSPGYYGWAPLRPGISITVAFGSGYHEPDERWIFVRDRDITRSDVDRHYVNRTRNVTIIHNSTVINNTYVNNRRRVTYISGPPRNDVQKVTRTTIRPVVIKEDSKPGQHLGKGELQIYRPQVHKTTDNGRKPAPPKVVKLADVKPLMKRNAGNMKKENTPPVNRREQQKGAAPTNGRGKPVQNLNPNMNKGNQPRNKVAPGNEKKPERNVVPNNNNNNRSRQPKNAVPPNNRVQQPQKENPSNARGRQPKNTVPPNNRVQQPQKENPNNNRGMQQHGVVRNIKKQPQHAAPPKRNVQHKPDQQKPNEKKKEH